MKKFIPPLLFVLSIVLLSGCSQPADSGNTTQPPQGQISGQVGDFCDADNLCDPALSCIVFPGKSMPECVSGDPCDKYQCPEGTECAILESFPEKLVCAENKPASNTDDSEPISNPAETSELLPASSEETNAKNFLISKMIGSEGQVYATFKDTYKSSVDAVLNHEVSAESTALAMLYAVKSDDRELFDKEYQFLKKYLPAENSLLYWKLNVDLSPAAPLKSNSRDNLQAAHAMLLAYEKWQSQDYKDTALLISDSAKQNLVDKDYLITDYTWDSGQGKKSIQLQISFADFAAMKQLAKYDPAWQKPLDNTKLIVYNSRLVNGLYRPVYNYSNTQYTSPGYLDMVDELYSAVHSASSNPLKVETLMENLGKQFYDEGSIAQAYKPAFFARGTSNENPAVYALSSRLAMLDNNTQFADDLVARMKTMQISDSASENYGAFLGTENDAIYSTWQLHCLIALAEKREQ